MSGDITYSIEHAKSGRSKCKKCKTKIDKDQLRIGKETPGPDNYNMQSWFHAECFPFPLQLKKEGITVEIFVKNILQDATEEHILESKEEEIVAMLSAKKPKTPKKAKNENTKVGRIRAIIQDEQGQKGEEPPKKKAKTLSAQEQGEIEAYGIYARKKVDELKDFMRWNQQPVTGTKDELLLRVIDGHLNGPIGKCVLCEQGRLSFEDDSGENLICKGYYDESIGARVPCKYTCKIEDAPRKGAPWFTHEPTEAELDSLKDKEEDTGDAAPLLERAKKLEWDLSDNERVKKATAAIIGICTSGDGPRVAVPEDDDDARREVGALVASNRSSSAVEALELVIEKYGLTEQNEKKAQMKKKSAEKSCANPANAAIYEAINELKELYFKESNRNAGLSYMKAAQAILDLEFEITEENAKKLGKPGKLKVDGIGKGTAEKIHEFLTTGTIQKLEEKRSIAA